MSTSLSQILGILPDFFVSFRKKIMKSDYSDTPAAVRCYSYYQFDKKNIGAIMYEASFAFFGQTICT